MVQSTRLNQLLAGQVPFFRWRRFFLLEQAFSLVLMFMTALQYSPQRLGNGWFVINSWFNLQD
jgi:hypothetical protein